MALLIGNGEIHLGMHYSKDLTKLSRVHDSIAPTVSSFEPANDSKEVSVDVNLVITFDEYIIKGKTGNITIKNQLDDSVVEIVAITDNIVTISKKIVTIDLLANLDDDSMYYVQIDSTCFQDYARNFYSGINDKITWTFSCDITPPTVTQLNPYDDQYEVSVDSNLEITFHENVQKGTGNIIIKKTIDDSIVETIDVISDIVSISDNVVTINPSENLVVSTGYYIQIANTAFKDMSDNNYIGISDSTTWNFRTPFAENYQKLGNLSTDWYKWVDAAYATSNKCVYCMPLDYSTILKINPIDDTTSEYGTLAGSTKWYGTVYSPVADAVYGIPMSATTICKIVCSTDTVSTFGSIAGTYKWAGGVYVASNQCIYGIPLDSATVLKIASDDTISTFGSLGSGGSKWVGGVIADNGKIYCTPFDSRYVLVIDPSDDSTSLIDTGDTNIQKFQGCVHSPTNGCVYCMPDRATYILKIDTSDDSISQITGIDAGLSKWCFGVYVESNGKIYGIPRSEIRILVIDTADDSISYIDVDSGTHKWLGGCHSVINNAIYAAPHKASKFMKLN